MLTHRLQILLDEGQYRLLTTEAERCRSSVAAIIRQAIDRRLQDNLAKRKAAIEAILAAEPIELPADPMDIKRELQEARDRFQC